jgi:prephenate dehydrogenase
MSRTIAPVTTIAAVRGAVTVPADTPRAIRASTARLLTALLEINRLEVKQVVSALFTSTPDLDSDYPAHAARRLGWTEVPLLGARELLPPGALPRVVRVLLTVRDVPVGRRLRPAYLGRARALRPDLGRARLGHALPGPGGATPGKPRIALVGLGQIGGSLGLALAGSGWWRTGYDSNAGARRRALRAGAIDRACPSAAEACADSDLAVVAVPMDRMPAAITAAARALPGGAALLDTGSARGALVDALERARRLGVRAVGGHPLAGTHGRGFAAARADLFEGATFCLIGPAGGIPEVVRSLVRRVGARALRVTAGEHDRAVARTSHLPYLVACAVRDMGRNAARRGLSGPSFADVTRVAASDPAMAEAYCRANAAEIAAAWRRLRDTLDRRIERLAPRTRRGVLRGPER